MPDDATNRYQKAVTVLDAGKSDEARQSFTRLANEGHGPAALKLCEIYVGDKLGKPDRETSVIWLRKAAELGHAQAQYWLGELLYYGYVFPGPDFTEARTWLKAAAEQNIPEAAALLGYLHGKGLGGAKDYRESERWLLRAAMLGDARAHYHLGIIYAEGNLGIRDIPKAYHFLQQSVAQGCSEAVSWRDSVRVGMTPEHLEMAETIAQESRPRLQ